MYERLNTFSQRKLSAIHIFILQAVGRACNSMQRMFLIFVVFGTRDLFNISYSRELYLFSKFLHVEEIVRVKMAVCFEMIVSET